YNSQRRCRRLSGGNSVCRLATAGQLWCQSGTVTVVIRRVLIPPQAVPFFWDFTPTAWTTWAASSWPLLRSPADRALPNRARGGGDNVVSTFARSGSGPGPKPATPDA